jgi:putative glutamine amidotransferase
VRPLIGVPCAGNLRSRYRRYCVGKRYCHALEMAGGAPVLLPLLDDGTLLDIYQRLDGLLLVGGGDVDPRSFGEVRQARLSGVDRPRDRAELCLTRRAIRDDLPLLAICRGLQVLNVALGGTLYQDIPRDLPDALEHNLRFGHPRNYLGHEVLITPGSGLAEVLGAERLDVNSLHHQAAKDVAPNLRIAACAPDGVVEGLEAPQNTFVVGVQWHPEELTEDDARMQRLFEAFVSQALRGHSS